MKQWEVMSAPRAGITKMMSRASGTTSTLRNGMANAGTATLNGSGMTAMIRGGSLTALIITTLTLGGYTAGGSGIDRTKVTTMVATRAKVTTGSMKPNMRISAAEMAQ